MVTYLQPRLRSMTQGVRGEYRLGTLRPPLKIFVSGQRPGENICVHLSIFDFIGANTFQKFSKPKKRKRKKKKRGRPSGHDLGHPLDGKQTFFLGQPSPITTTL